MTKTSKLPQKKISADRKKSTNSTVSSACCIILFFYRPHSLALESVLNK